MFLITTHDHIFIKMSLALCKSNEPYATDVNVDRDSFLSASGLMGAPAEMYRYGTMQSINVLTFVAIVPVASYLYAPMFHRLQVASSFEVKKKKIHTYIYISIHIHTYNKYQIIPLFISMLIEYYCFNKPLSPTSFVQQTRN